MVDQARVTGIDPSSWQATILPLPKGFTRGTALGFCGGEPVGRAETARARSCGCWWPRGQPELLSLAGYKEVQTGRAGGDTIPGQWLNPTSGAMGAVVWRRRGEHLEGADLHDRAYAATWATGAGGGVAVGIGSPRGKLGQRGPDVGLVWPDAEEVSVVTGDDDVVLCATDGRALGGSLGGRATLWASVGAPAVDLAPAGMPTSEVEAMDGEWQVGVAWGAMCARAGLWRGTAASFRDLTPTGFETARANGAAGGFQVGAVRVRDATRNGSAACDDRAALWQGAADRWFDLNALLPEGYNASVAWAVAVDGGEIRICGEASRCEVSDPGTTRESHFVPVAHPILWTARLDPTGG